MSHLVELTENGLYCPAGQFYVDPWRGVDRAIITHAHSDHARGGSRQYVCSREGVDVLRVRLGSEVTIDTLEYGEPLHVNGVRVSLHPAGHVLGSAQVRLEHRGQVCVVSGDYKTVAEPSCTPFEPVSCHVFISECTFGLPIYHWPDQQTVVDDIHQWWQDNIESGRTSILFAYSLGKAQRILAALGPSLGPILVHGAVLPFVEAYRSAGVTLPDVEHATEELARQVRGRALVIAPGSAAGSPWMRKFAPYSLASASGWMRIRGARRRQALDRGFVLSDHADWPGLLSAIDATGAEQVWLTHGNAAPLIRWLTEQGRHAQAVATPFAGEAGESEGANRE